MATVERSISIHAPVENVFAYVTNPMTQTEWMPSMVEVTDVIQTKQGVGSTFHWRYKMGGMTLEGDNETLEFVPNKRVVARSKGGIDSTWTWEYEPEEDGTRLSVHIEYTIPVPVMGKIAENLLLRQNEKEADLAMANIKTKMEG